MALIPQITQMDFARQLEPICKISVISAICVRFWTSPDA